MNAASSSSLAQHEEGQYLTVGELILRLNQVLEEVFLEVTFNGELSSLKRAPSGHIYMTIRDPSAEMSSQIDVVMWAQQARRLSFEPREGMVVICQGRPTVYRERGKLQIVLSRMMEYGEGAFRRRYLELKAKLEAEGLFQPERKRAIPFLPKAVGVVTSKAGAAIHDIEVKIRQRMPNMRVYLCDARVQGEGASTEIAAGINYLSRSGLVDVIICGRGGGSLEDLWAFNEEQVVRAIFASKVPVISAVGHEVDLSLSDLVADLRAPTPTAAAEMVVPNREELFRRLELTERRLVNFDLWLMPRGQRLDSAMDSMEQAILRYFSMLTLKVERTAARVNLLEPKKLLTTRKYILELLEGKLSAALLNKISLQNRKLVHVTGKLRERSPLAKIVLFHERLTAFSSRFTRAVNRVVEREGDRVDSVFERLKNTDPQLLLQRGYSLTFRDDGTLLRSIGGVRSGDALRVRVADGEVKTVVEGIE